MGGSLLRGACDRAVYSVLQEDQSSGTAAALCRLVKLWAKRRKLTNTLKGGLSSFALVLLTIFFLQQRSGKQCSLPSQLSVTGPRAKPANPENCCPQPLGLEVVASEKELVHLFAEFFEWATEELPKLQNCAISIGSATAQQQTGRFHPLVVEVPFSSSGERSSMFAHRCLGRCHLPRAESSQPHGEATWPQIRSSSSLFGADPFFSICIICGSRIYRRVPSSRI